MLIRAKFRVLEVKQRLETTRVEMKPVIAKSASWPGGCEENARFWEATPAGDAGFWFPDHEAAVVPAIRSYWYIDMVEDPNGAYVLASVTAREGSREVWLSSHRGDVKMDIHNRDVWPAFDLERIGKRWSVTLTPADAPAAGLHSYP
jgi:hypothetical protein